MDAHTAELVCSLGTGGGSTVSNEKDVQMQCLTHQRARRLTESRQETNFGCPTQSASVSTRDALRVSVWLFLLLIDGTNTVHAN